MLYEHTQNGPLAYIVLAFFTLVLTLVATAAGEPGEALITGLIMIPILLLVVGFSRLKVSVTAKEVKAAFWIGWPHRTIQLSELTSIREVRNKWWYGLGIRVAPNGAWIYNVWGLDAVELEQASGKKFRIGTNDPTGLIAALSLQTSLRPATD